MNVSEDLRAAAHRAATDVGLTEVRAGVRADLTWGELDAAADDVARSLSGRGLRAGQRVALVMANRIDFVVAYYGVLRGGMIAVPMNPRSTTAEIARMITDSEAHLILADETAIAAVREAVADRPVPVVVAGAEPQGDEISLEAFRASATTAEPVAPVDPEAIAVILYTSGSTGRPRGAMLSHRALLANIDQVAALEMTRPDDVCLGLLPLFHVYGLTAVLGQAVRQGARVVVVDGFDPSGLLTLVLAESVTQLPLAPPVVAAWAGRPDLRTALAGVRLIISGAAPLDADVAEAFRESSGHAVEQGYGLTEAAPVVAVTAGAPRAADGGPVPGTVGQPLPGVEVRLVDPAVETTRPATTGDPAEIWIRGDNLFSGYWPDGADGPRPDGWYPTGDVGVFDEQGNLVLVDRLRELVIVSGFNVYPREVEDVIAEAPGVAQVAVVGAPDPDTGEAVIAFVVPLPGSTDLAVREAIEAACRTRLARFKQPTQVVVVDHLPHSATGKIAKGRLRALARAEGLGLLGGA